MDLHHVDTDLTQEDLDAAHLEDIRVQGKYGLEHKKYYVNFEEKTVFCLIKAPDKKSLHDAHAEVHGVGPCNIVEVSSLTPTYDFNAMIGEEGGKNEWDVALTRSGEIDTGYRTLLRLWSLDLAPNYPERYHRLLQVVEKYDGKIVKLPDHSIMATFLHAQDAVLCSRTMQSLIRSLPSPPKFCIALVNGRPVDDTGQVLFEESVDLLQSFCYTGRDQYVYMDEPTLSLFKKGQEDHNGNLPEDIRILSSGDTWFMLALGRELNRRLGEAGFTVEELASHLGLSRAQAYRRIRELTGRPPNALIREFRLRKALEQLRSSDRTVAEVSYLHGFGTPGYFSKVFQERFGLLPSKFRNKFGH